MPRRTPFVVSLTLMLALVLCTSFAVGADEKPNPGNTPPGPVRVACVGDSITFGYGIAKGKTYPDQLGRLLGEGYDVRNFGVSGSTLLKKGDQPYVKESAYAKALEFGPQIVIIKLGTNDTKPQNWSKKADFVRDYKEMIAEFHKANPGVKVYVCTPVPAFPGNWGINDEDIKNGVAPLVREVAKDTHATIIDLYAALDGKSQFFPDKVHPNAEGAAVIAAEVARVLDAKATSQPSSKPGSTARQPKGT